MTATISRTSAILGAARTLAAKLLLAITIDRAALTQAMTNANLFPSMVLQMCAIGEESGSIDHMLGKSADFYEAEVDDMVAGISSLMEPIIIVILGTVIGGIVVAMYLPIFKLGQVV